MCTEWEKTGLLYSSGELDEEGRSAYAKHLSECESCRAELDRYLREHARLYTPSVLEEVPSDVVDREILRVCSQSKVVPTSVSFFSIFARRAVLSALLLVVGFGGGLYVTYNVQQARGVRVAQDENRNQESLALQEELLPPADTVDSASSGTAARVFDTRDAARAAREVVPVAQQQ